MSATSSLSDILQTAFDSTDTPVEFVDGLLRVCAEHEVHLRLQADSGLLRSTKPGSSEYAFPNPLSKSRFRAVLARFAVLCNKATPGSASPYGGAGTVHVGHDRFENVRVAFANTLDEQFIDIQPFQRPE